jgi:hydroxymethylbilane synthase
LQSRRPIRLGTRGSPLAMAQAHAVRDALIAAHGLAADDIEIVGFTSTADRLVDRPLSEVGGKGLFTKEIDIAQLAGDIDIAVHSSKDVATTPPEGLVLAAYLEREDVRDAFLSLTAADIDRLPERAKFGTSSIRRAAQVLRLRPDLTIVPFRGNVQTRLQKLVDGVASATLLALAGLNRLDQAHRATAILDAKTFMPAPAQGAIGIAIRHDDTEMAGLIAAIDHEQTRLTVTAERAMLGVLDGSCRTPIAALSTVSDGRLTLHGEILSLDGRHSVEDVVDGDLDAASDLGTELGRRLLQKADPALLKGFSR